MEEIILLSDNEITSSTPLGGNIDVDKYRFCIIDAQNSKLEEVLGENLFNKILADFQAETLTGNYEVLFSKYIKPFLIHQSALEYILCAAYMVDNGGIYRHTPQNGQPADKTEVDFIANNQRNKAEMYCNRMEKWLCKNKSSIPEFKYNDQNIVNPKPQTNGPWYF